MTQKPRKPAKTPVYNLTDALAKISQNRITPQEANTWLRAFAVRHEIGFDDLIDDVSCGAQIHKDSDWDLDNAEREEFWDNIAAIVGHEVQDNQKSAFTCAR